MEFSDLNESFFKSLPDPVLFLDKSEFIIDCNDAFLALSKTNISDLKGKSFWDLTTDKQDLSDGSDCELDWANAGRLIFTAVRLKKNREHIGYALIAHPASLTSVTSPGKQFQQKKFESLGVLASAVAHDLNNILTAVLGHVSYLRVSTRRTANDSLQAIEDGARRAAALTGQILEFARGGDLDITSVNLNQVVSAELNLIKASLPSTAMLSVIEQASDVVVLGEQTQLSQLILNLIINARDALRPEGGKIELVISKVSIKFPQIQGNFEIDSGEYASLTVRDTGEGMSIETKSRIFEPFFTTKRHSKRGGTGIGMATVASIVRGHRGSIQVESSVGQGTSFEVLLPLVKEQELRIASLHIDKKPERGNERILVVDDEETVRIVMEKSLQHLGYEVEVACDGAEALSLFKKDSKFDLVILDMIMPNLSGDELFYKLREIRPDVSVLIASGYSSDSRTSAVLRDGAKGFIQKPFAVDELSREVRICIDNK